MLNCSHQDPTRPNCCNQPPCAQGSSEYNITVLIDQVGGQGRSRPAAASRGLWEGWAGDEGCGTPAIYIYIPAWPTHG